MAITSGTGSKGSRSGGPSGGSGRPDPRKNVAQKKSASSQAASKKAMDARYGTKKK